MDNKHLHIVAFNIPFPADYGGVIDIYYRILALSRAGIRIHLHCYTYGRQPAPELAAICEEVYYYKRTTRIDKLFTREPYIVSSRQSRQLINNLLKDNYPILLEGLHNGWVLEQLHAISPTRRIFIRAHNVEHDYYKQLGLVEQHPLKRIYLQRESTKLKHYETIMRDASIVFAITEKDASHFRAIGCPNVVLLPGSHPYSSILSYTGSGNYAIYHGNLSVPENIEAALHLINEVFTTPEIPLVIAGKDPNSKLLKAAGNKPWITILANPSDEVMEEKIANAQVNILITKQDTGLKLKLLHSLFCGRHCLVNEPMVSGTDFANLCWVANSSSGLKNILKEIMETPFTEELINKRKLILNQHFSVQSAILPLVSNL